MSSAGRRVPDVTSGGVVLNLTCDQSTPQLEAGICLTSQDTWEIIR
jgi:hypothetical protein